MANRFWIGGDGDWSDTAHWSASSGGAGGASAPSTSDVAIFDASSDVAGANFTATVDSATTITTLTISSVDVLVTIASTTNLTVSAACVISAASASAGLKVTSNFTVGTSITLSSGTFDFTDVVVSAATTSSNNSNTRSMTFGTSGKIVLSGSAATIWSTATLTNFSYTGTPLIELTYSGSTGTRTIAGGFTGALESNVVSFKIIGGTDTLSFTNSHYVLDLDFNTFAGTLADTAIRIFGNLTLSSGMTVAASANVFSMYASSGTKIITTNNLTVDKPLNIGIAGSTATFKLADNLTLGSTRTLQHTSGTFDANNKNINIGQFTSANNNTRTILMGSGSWTLNGGGSATVWNTGTITGLTLNANTSTVYFSSSSTQNTLGGGVTINDAVISGSGVITFNSINFNRLSNTVQPITVRFVENVTNTFNDFALSGTAGNLVTIQSATAGTRTILSQASGTVNVSYCSIKDTTATGGATWNAYYDNGNIDAGNNVNWNFGGTPSYDTEYGYKLRSFTEQGRF